MTILVSLSKSLQWMFADCHVFYPPLVTIVLFWENFMMSFFSPFKLMREPLRSNAFSPLLFLFSIVCALHVQADSTCATNVRGEAEVRFHRFDPDEQHEFSILLRKSGIRPRWGMIRPEVDVYRYYLNSLSSSQYSELFTGNILKNNGGIHFGAKVPEIGIDLQHSWDSDGLLLSSYVVSPHLKVSLFENAEASQIEGSITYYRENLWQSLEPDNPKAFRVNSRVQFEIPSGFRLATYAVVEESERHRLSLILRFRNVASLSSRLGEVVARALSFPGNPKISPTSINREIREHTLVFEIKGEGVKPISVR